MRAFLNAARWPGVSTVAPCKARRPVMHRRLSVEPLEDRRVLSASSFVPALYQDVLGRAPDPSGRRFYTNLLATSTPPSTVVADIWESAEHRGIEVDSYYQTLFNRAADPTGRQFWVTSMLAGVTEETVMASFLNSPEFQQLNSLPTQFVTALYNDVLGRPPDGPGESYWTTALTNNTAAPADIIGDFINSTERHVNLVDSYYAIFLQRASDASGQASWVQQLDQGLVTDGSAAQFFLTSQEFISDNPLPPLVAGPGQVVVTVVGNGYVTDSTGQIDTRIGQNVATYGANDFPILQASSSSVTWSDPAFSGQNPALSPSDFANGLNVTAFFI
jgi:hypothetical protein